MTDQALVPQTTTTTEIVSQFGTLSGFELLQRQAKMLSNSSLVPEQFSFYDKAGKLKDAAGQSLAIANSVIALEISQRIQASPLMVAQNLIVINGRPTWSSQFVIAAINASGKFSPLRFDIKGDGDARQCIAWAYDLATNDRLEGPPVSIAMAKKEGWYQKNGSKWQSLPELMLRYRSATFFGRLYAPDLLMGMRSADEAIDTPPDDVIEMHQIEPSKISDINAEIRAAKSQQKIANVTPEVKEEPKTIDQQPDDQAPELSKEYQKLREQFYNKANALQLDQWAYSSQSSISRLSDDEKQALQDEIAARRAELQAIEHEEMKQGGEA